MIVRDRPGLLRLFFILRGSVIGRIFPQVLFVFLISALVVWAHGRAPGVVPTFSGAPFALLGIALSVFLGFRNNACYDRWWEGRKIWGGLIATSRDLARQTLILEDRAPEAAAARARLMNLAMTFAHALVIHLRPGADAARPLAHLPADLAPAFAASRNRPDFTLRAMGAVLARLRAASDVSDIEFSLLDRTLVDMTAALTACERLLNTPVPFGYTLLLHRTAYLFCFLLPFGFADALGWTMPFATALIAYAFFGLDALGDELEEPFGDLPNDLPIAAMAMTIELLLREARGDADLPPPPAPVDYVLM